MFNYTYLIMKFNCIHRTQEFVNQTNRLTHNLKNQKILRLYRYNMAILFLGFFWIQKKEKNSETIVLNNQIKVSSAF